MSHDEYEGEYKNDLKHGIGKMIYKPKTELKEGGEVKEDRKESYYGYWEEGRRNGEGVYTYEDGDIYSGNWKNNKRDGKGTYIFAATGIKYVGNWSEGNFVHGKWLFSNGTYFEGNFEANQPKGVGKWIFKNGDVVEGEYSHTIIQDAVDAPKTIKLKWRTTVDIDQSNA